MRVLHVAQPLDAGVPRVAGDLVADQAARGWDVAVASPADGDLRALALAAGARHLAWEAVRSPGRGVPGEARRLAAILRAEAPDLVHLHSAKAGLAGRLVLRGRRPTVFQPHAWSFDAVTGAQRAAVVAWERAAARWADAIVCVSAGERDRGRAAGVRGRWAVLPNGVDVDRFGAAGEPARAAARERLGLGPGPLAVIVGRLSEQKGQPAAVRAWPRVRALVPGAELALVGDGPLRDELAAAAGDGVRLAGASRDVATWLAAADLLCAPSGWEAALSLAAMEAMARGRSVVAYAAAGARESVGDAGAVVEVGDEAGLVAAIVERLRDPALAAREGAAGRRRVCAMHDVRVTRGRYAGLYAEVLARQGGR